MIVTINLPPDLYAYMLECQNQTKIERNSGKYSQEKAILAIIRQHKELIEELARLKEQYGEKE